MDVTITATSIATYFKGHAGHTILFSTIGDIGDVLGRGTAYPLFKSSVRSDVPYRGFFIILTHLADYNVSSETGFFT